jgi:hypothetical protein
MYYYMIDLIQLPSPYVPIDNYSHMMAGDEVTEVDIIVGPMVMMKTTKSPSPKRSI